MGIKDELKKRVVFHHANLFQQELPAVEPMDVILCRNVMIYFDRETQEELVQRLSRRLVPDGYLLIGHSESLLDVPHCLTPVSPSLFRLHAPAGQEAVPRLTPA